MIRYLLICIFLNITVPAWADIVVSKRIIRPQTVLSVADLDVLTGQHPDAYGRVIDVAGQEARVALYPGRPIRLADIGPPALIKRNQIVLLRYRGSGLVIKTEGRALERGGIGDRVRIMNLSSKSTLFGFVQEDGSIRVVQ